ncbi:uncharacterized protein M421DRAFT_93247 [Didymella exigua CBS 183.55]|uniref:Uncharacterized protein n=1 Tax=Didymella exigua CBS 183.55 TaxID=1150837 RepID=A0A6A5RGE3_9PLEO|nr:uncharacterized protein M421DRAFT_93247 [Didymella exigua CBS 183.55]KAF1927381.1 hypothetical protein M421DRAFT_93247 [Didymella exigua CBS 183.55]
MSRDSNLLEALEALRSMPLSAYELGPGIAQLLLHIPELIWRHLDHPVNFRNLVSGNLRFPAFVGAVDELIKRLRNLTGTHNALPNWQISDREERRRQLRYVRGASATIEAAYKYCMIEVFEDRFLGWSEKETQ